MSPTTADMTNVLKLKAKLLSLSPADQLRVAAELIEKREYDLAEAIAQRIVDDLCALRIARL